jgi:hypothetical protein
LFSGVLISLVFMCSLSCAAGAGGSKGKARARGRRSRAAAAAPLPALNGGAVEKKQVYFEYAKVQWESEQVGKMSCRCVGL